MNNKTTNAVPTRTDAPMASFDGGHLMLDTLGLCMVWGLYRDGALQARDVRVWLACHELREERRIAARMRSRRPGNGRREQLEPRYRREQLAVLTGHRTGGGGEGVRDSLRRLRQCGLVQFSSTGIEFASSPDELAASIETVASMRRAMPAKRSRFSMPRRTLRMLCGSSTKAVLASAFAQLLHCCYWHRRDGWSTVGRCKASWIAETFGLSTRSVDRARKHLVELGWMKRLAPEQPVEHVHENNFGARYEVCLHFARTVAEEGFSTARMSPREAQNASRLSPPESNRSLSSRSKHQEPGTPQARQIDSWKEEGGELPSWNKIVPADLRSMPRLMELYDQVVARGVLEGGSFTEQLNFAAAAQRARARGTLNPCGLFRRLVERKLWSHVTNDDEETVRVPLTRFLNGEPIKEPERRSAPRRRPRLSDDGAYLQRLLIAMGNRGIRQRAMIFRELNSRQPEWTESRWDSAIAEFDSESQEDSARFAAFA